MIAEAILELVRQQFADEVLAVSVQNVHPHAVIRRERWHDIALFLRDDPRLGFDWLRCLTGVDQLEDKRFVLVFDLHATRRPAQPEGLWQCAGEIAIKVQVPRDDPHVASVADVWPAANWHEREAYDLLGVIFDGHPDPRRILCCDDWVGHPLRKDYEFPLEYRGIPAVTEYAQTRPQH